MIKNWTKTARFCSFAAILSLSACGGGEPVQPLPTPDWTEGVFLDAELFKNRCAVPRAGSNTDVQGSVLTENHWLRSFTNDTYLWYDEIVDQDPAEFDDPVTYFGTLRTEAVTASGKPKDEFSFSIATEAWLERQQGVSAGYGFSFSLLSRVVPREAVIIYSSPDTPATAEGADLARGDRILAINGVDFINDNTQLGIETLNAALFPDAIGETYQFTILDASSGETRTVSLTSQEIFTPPVQNLRTIISEAGDVGYLTFLSFNNVSEAALVEAFQQLALANVSELVLDLRYNGGGLSSISSQLAYMIAGDTATAGQTYKLLTFNDKHPTINPITGETLSPTPFINESIGFGSGLPGGQALPSLDLNRLVILSGSNTCSASESLINGLRGINFEVILVGDTTCGKPYGFYAIDNCGTTYFPVQIQNQNGLGFGDYADGFSPNDSSDAFAVQLPGCQVADDYENLLGDIGEARLATALFYLENNACPPEPAKLSPSWQYQNDGDVPTIWRTPKLR